MWLRWKQMDPAQRAIFFIVVGIVGLVIYGMFAIGDEMIVSRQ